MQNVFLMCGIPGSGKSTWANNILINGVKPVVISRDKIRFALLKEGEEYFSHEKEVVAKLYEELENGMKNVPYVIVDATHLNIRSRQKTLDKVREFAIKNNLNVITSCFCFIVPFAEACRRNREREARAVVPQDRMQEMYSAFIIPNKINEKIDNIYFINQDGRITSTCGICSDLNITYIDESQGMIKL